MQEKYGVEEAATTLNKFQMARPKDTSVNEKSLGTIETSQKDNEPSTCILFQMAVKRMLCNNGWRIDWESKLGR